MQHPPDSNRSTPEQFRSKLGTYLTGVAIGCLLLGAMYYQKHKAVQHQQAAAESAPDSTIESTPPPETTP